MLWKKKKKLKLQKAAFHWWYSNKNLAMCWKHLKHYYIMFAQCGSLWISFTWKPFQNPWCLPDNLNVPTQFLFITIFSCFQKAALAILCWLGFPGLSSPGDAGVFFLELLFPWSFFFGNGFISVSHQSEMPALFHSALNHTIFSSVWWQ